MASPNEIKVKTSLMWAKLIPRAEPLANPTCMVSFRFVIFICFRLVFQVGFKLSYVF